MWTPTFVTLERPAVASVPAAFRGSCGVPRPSMADYVRGLQTPRAATAAARRANVDYPLLWGTVCHHVKRGGQPASSYLHSRKRLRRGTFRSVPALIAAIRRYVREHNKDPR